MADLSMTLACQWGRCDDCPEADDWDPDWCACTCHIPDDEPDDELEQWA